MKQMFCYTGTLTAKQQYPDATEDEKPDESGKHKEYM